MLAFSNPIRAIKFLLLNTIALNFLGAQESGNPVQLSLERNINDPDQWLLSWSSESSQVYFVQQSNDLVNWSWHSFHLPEEAKIVEESVSIIGDRGFFRLQYTEFSATNTSPLLTDDFDGDSLSNYDEINMYSVMGLDPLNSDSDGNGINDGLEDADGDGRNNALEFTEKTDPMDYYDGVLPNLIIFSGNNQEVSIGEASENPLVVRVYAEDINLFNAPVNYQIIEQFGTLILNPEGTTETGVVDIEVRTDGNGLASVYFSAPNTDLSPGDNITVRASIETAGQENFQEFTVRLMGFIKAMIASAGGDQSFVFEDDLLSTGENIFGQLGDGANTDKNSFSPITSLVGEAVDQIAAGENHTIILLDSGACYVFGRNWYGQLGLGDTTDQSVPMELCPIKESISQVAAGQNHSLILTDAGTTDSKIWYFGDNRYRLGIDDTSVAYILQPTDLGLSLGSPVSQITSGSNHILVLCADGTVWAWGDNRHGQVAASSSSLVTTPLAIDLSVFLTGTSVREVIASGNYSLALLDNGDLIGWGEGAYGQLNMTGLYESSGPSLIASNVQSVAAGEDMIVLKLEDGRLLSAGLNDSGQLGRATSTGAKDGFAIIDFTEIVYALDAGASHVLLSTQTGELYGFGRNQEGQLGLDNTTTHTVTSPTLIP